MGSHGATEATELDQLIANLDAAIAVSRRGAAVWLRGAIPGRSELVSWRLGFSRLHGAAWGIAVRRVKREPGQPGEADVIRLGVAVALRDAPAHVQAAAAPVLLDLAELLTSHAERR